MHAGKKGKQNVKQNTHAIATWTTNSFSCYVPPAVVTTLKINTIELMIEFESES